MIRNCQWNTLIKEVLLRITIDRELKFDDHSSSLCKKASQKLDALPRFTPSSTLIKGEKSRKLS